MNHPVRREPVSYRNLAIEALKKAIGYDPMIPKSEAVVTAWAEALEDARLDNQDDILMAVRVMYRNHGDPGWRATPRVLVLTAREVKKLRQEREEQQADDEESRHKVTYAEFRARHPEVQFPKFGKSVADA